MSNSEFLVHQVFLRGVVWAMYTYIYIYTYTHSIWVQLLRIVVVLDSEAPSDGACASQAAGWTTWSYSRVEERIPANHQTIVITLVKVIGRVVIATVVVNSLPTFPTKLE